MSNRTHCIAWSDYDTQPQVELQHGIRFDTNYYYWPGSWIQDRPGLFTGSGFPQRFATAGGDTIDVYQATTQMTDESDQTYPATINTLLDNAMGPLGYYGAFTANIHTDTRDTDAWSAIVASAQARGVPLVSARQMLDWLDGAQRVVVRQRVVRRQRARLHTSPRRAGATASRRCCPRRAHPARRLPRSRATAPRCRSRR